MSTHPVPPLDPRAGTCASCGAIMAADQRYCLSCGARRDGGRLPFRDALVADAAPQQQVLPAPVAYYAPAPSAGGGTSPTLLTTLAALACVLLAFGVGVLVGDRGGSQQPVVVGGAAPQAAAPTTTDAAATADGGSGSDSSSKDSASSGGDESATPSKPKAAPKKVVEESKQAIKSLESAKTPKQAAEASKNLPDVVVTGGGDPNAGGGK